MARGHVLGEGARILGGALWGSRCSFGTAALTLLPCLHPIPRRRLTPSDPTRPTPATHGYARPHPRLGWRPAWPDEPGNWWCDPPGQYLAEFRYGAAQGDASTVPHGQGMPRCQLHQATHTHIGAPPLDELLPLKDIGAPPLDARAHRAAPCAHGCRAETFRLPYSFAANRPVIVGGPPAAVDLGAAFSVTYSGALRVRDIMGWGPWSQYACRPAGRLPECLLCFTAHNTLPRPARASLPAHPARRCAHIQRARTAYMHTHCPPSQQQYCTTCVPFSTLAHVHNQTHTPCPARTPAPQAWVMSTPPRSSRRAR